MGKWLLAFVLLLCSLPLQAQQVVVTGQAVDSDGQEWIGGTYQITLIRPGGLPNFYCTSTGTNFQASFGGTLDGTGSFSVQLTSTGCIVPTGSLWQVTICPNVTGAACGTIQIPVTASGSISSKINAAILAPRVTGGPGIHAYSDIEVAAFSPNTYFNVISQQNRCYSTAWAVCTASNNISPQVINGVSYSVAYPQSGLAERVNACLTDAINQQNGNTSGICDATGETGRQTTDETITVGNSSGVGVVLIMPCSQNIGRGAVWQGGFTGGTSPVMLYYDGAVVTSNCVANVAGTTLTTTSTSNASYVFQQVPSSSPYMYIKGLGVTNIGGGHATATGIGAYFSGGADDATLLDGMSIYDSLDTYAAEINGGCCSFTWQNSSINGGEASTPLFLNTTNASTAKNQVINFINDTIVAPGAGKPAMYCSDTSSNPSYSIVNFDNIYTETNTSDTTTTLYQINGCAKVSFNHVSIGSNVTNSQAAAISYTSVGHTELEVDDLQMFPSTGYFGAPVKAVYSPSGGSIYTDANGHYGKFSTGAIALNNPSVATSGTNYSSPLLWMCGNYWNSSAAQFNCTTQQMVFPNGSTPASQYQFRSSSGTSSGGLTYSFDNNLSSTNFVSATSGANTSSPSITLTGNIWNGSASATEAVTQQLTFNPGINPQGFYNFTPSITGVFFKFPNSAGVILPTGSTYANVSQPAANAWAGKCTMTTTSCTVTLANTYTTPICVATLQGTGTVIAGECSVSGATATVTAASSNTGTWAVAVFGDPN